MSKADIDELRIVVQADDKDASKTLDALVSKLTALKEASKGFRKNKALESWASKAEEANNSLSAMAKTIDAISSSVASLSDAMGSFSSGVKDATSSAKKLEDALQVGDKNDLGKEAADKASDALATATEKARGFASVFSVIGTVARGVGGFFSRVGQIGATAFGKVQSATHATISTFKRIGSVVSNTATQFSKISKSALGFATLPFKPVINGVKSIDDRLFGIFKSLLRIAKLRIFRGIIKSITAGLREGISNAYQWANVMGNQFAGSMDRVATSAQYLKNSLGAMAMPIFNALAPVLDALIDKVVTLLNAINQLIAKLTGASGWTKAVKVPKAYASGMADAAGSAEKLKQELITILGIDELNVMEGANDSGSGGGGGGAGGGFTEMFEESTFSENINNLADMIKKSWANADFTDLGTMIGEKIKGALDGIPWDAKIKPVASKLGKSLATLLNGVIEVENLGRSIGGTIAEVYNTALNFAYELIHNFHWDSLGEFIGDSINGFTSKVDLEKLRQSAKELGRGIGNTINSVFSTTNWADVGHTIGESMNAVFDFLYNLGDEIDFELVGSSVATAINNWASTFDFRQAGATLGKWADGVLDLAIKALQDTDWNEVGKKAGEFLEGIDLAELLKDLFVLGGNLLVAIGGFAVGILEELWNGLKRWWDEGGLKRWWDGIWDGFFTAANGHEPIQINYGFKAIEGMTVDEAEVKVNATIGKVEKGLEKIFGVEFEDKTYDLKTRVNIALGNVDATARRILNKLFPELGLEESSSFTNPTVGVGGLVAGAGGINIQGATVTADKFKDNVPEKRKVLDNTLAVVQNGVEGSNYKPTSVKAIGEVASANASRSFRPPTIPTIGSVNSAKQGTGYKPATVNATGSITTAQPVSNLNATVNAKWSISAPVNVPESVTSAWNQNNKKPQNVVSDIQVPWNLNEKKPLNIVSSIYTAWNQNNKNPLNVVSSITTAWNQNNKKPINVPSDIIVPWNQNNKKPMNVVSDIIVPWNHNNKKPQNVVSDIVVPWNQNNKKPLNVVSDIVTAWNQNNKAPQNVPGSIKSAWYRSGDVQNVPGSIKTAWYRSGAVENVPSYVSTNWRINDYYGVSRVNATWNITDVTSAISLATRIASFFKADGGVFEHGKWHAIPQYAGGTVNAGSMFIAGEAGPELVGHVGGRTEVLNQSQLAATMSASVSEAQAPQNALLREQNALLRELIDRQGTIRAHVTTGDLVSGMQQMNRRDGRTVIPIGV